MLSARRRAQLGVLATFIVLAAALATLLVAPRLSKAVAVADVGTVAPDFQLTDTDGNGFTLSQHRGQAVVLFFGSVNCPHTATYNPRVERLARAFANDNRVAFVAMDMTSRTDPTAADRRMLRLDPRVVERSFPTLVDQKGFVASRYSAMETPTFVLIDAHGIVRYRGAFDDSADAAFVTQPLIAAALGDVLGAPTAALASFRP